MGSLKLSVIICTRDPQPELLQELLNALAGQQPASPDTEYIIVFNGGRAIDPSILPRDLDVKIIEEPTPGLVHARCKGINASSGDVLVFLDDDNIPAQDYLQAAKTHIARYDNAGVVGGKTVGRFDCEVSRWKRPLLAFVGVRDLGDAVIPVSGPKTCAADPIGAGMVVRSDVARAFVQYVEIGEADGLGRKPGKMQSGEDTLFSIIADKLGYTRYYTPDLALVHVIPKNRLSNGYLWSVIFSIGKAAAHIDFASGGLDCLRKISRIGIFLRSFSYVARFGPAGLIILAHPIGYREAALKLSPGNNGSANEI